MTAVFGTAARVRVEQQLQPLLASCVISQVCYAIGGVQDSSGGLAVPAVWLPDLCL